MGLAVLLGVPAVDALLQLCPTRQQGGVARGEAGQGGSVTGPESRWVDAGARQRLVLHKILEHRGDGQGLQVRLVHLVSLAGKGAEIRIFGDDRQRLPVGRSGRSIAAVSPAIFGLVLTAALVHASWNALLRSGADRRWSMLVMSGAQALVCSAALPFLGGMALAGWACAVASAVLHIGYNVSLVRAYRTGDLGQTYPIARGSSPLLVTLGAALVAGERLSLPALAGVALVSCGILALAFRGRRLMAESVRPALATGCFIGAYSVADGMGARLSGHAFAYIAWSEMLGSVLTALMFALPSSVRRRRPGRAEWLKSALGGVASVAAYGVVIWAMSHAPMGMVSALRETSVVFAAVLGRVFLAERLTFVRLTACSVIAGGAACIAYAG